MLRKLSMTSLGEITCRSPAFAGESPATTLGHKLTGLQYEYG